jgi:glutamine cyclotransferase
MKQSAAEIVREYGPFPGVDRVNGVTYDGQQVWFAAGDKLIAFDPASGKTLRSIDVPAHAGTAFDGQHLYQIAEGRIQKIDPKTGRVLATIPAQDPSSRSPNRGDSSHHRVQPLRHRCHLDRRRALARQLGR